MIQIEDPEIIKEVTKTARILLISIDRRIYLSLKQKGYIYPFEKVDFFSTIKEAETFFSNNPECLRQYTIIIVDDFIKKHYLHNGLDNYSTVATIGTHKIDNIDRFVFKMNNCRIASYDTSNEYTNYFSIDISQYIIWYINKYLKPTIPEQRPLPTKQEELQILITSEELLRTDEFSNLNITYGNLNNIIEESEPYDIIIFSNREDMVDIANLLNREKRRKTLLVTYSSKISYYYDDFNKIEKFPKYVSLEYQFAGCNTNDNTIHQDSFYILLSLYNDPVETSKKAILEAVAAIYNRYIPLQGFTLKEPEDYTTEMEETKQIVYT